MSQQIAEKPVEQPRTKPGVRWLTPQTTHVFEGTFSLLHCTVKGDTLYRGVFAVRMFPISHPDRFISLRYTDQEDKIREVGVIENLNEFPPEAQELVRASLIKQYFEKIIKRIYGITEEFGFLLFDVETQQGREKFLMPWRGDRAEDYSDNGKLLLDAYDNRHTIPDLDKLPAPDRRRLTRYIYW